jgi:hypothetical protein
MADPISLSQQEYDSFVRLRDLAAKYDGAEGLRKKIDKLEADNAGYRQKVQDLEKQAPAVGAVILPPEQAATWAKVEAVAKDAAAVDKLLADATEAETLRGEITKRDKAEKRRAAAEAEGVNVKALARVAGADEWEFDTGEEADPKDAAKKVPAGYVVKDGKKTRLAAYLQAEMPEIADALMTTPEKKPNGGAGGGIQFQPEKPAGGGKPGVPDHVAAVSERVEYSV